MLKTCILVASLGSLAACQSAPERVAPPAPRTLADSIILVRTQSYFRTGQAYLVRLSMSGAVRFESRMPGDTGRIAEARADPDSTRALFERAVQLRLETLPADLMGKAPWCRIIATDAPHVVIGLHAGERATIVRDYLGCFERNDESGNGVIRRLRAFEADVDRITGVPALLARGR